MSDAYFEPEYDLVAFTRGFDESRSRQWIPEGGSRTVYLVNGKGLDVFGGNDGVVTFSEKSPSRYPGKRQIEIQALAPGKAQLSAYKASDIHHPEARLTVEVCAPKTWDVEYHLVQGWARGPKINSAGVRSAFAEANRILGPQANVTLRPLEGSTIEERGLGLKTGSGTKAAARRFNSLLRSTTKKHCGALQVYFVWNAITKEHRGTPLGFYDDDERVVLVEFKTDFVTSGRILLHEFLHACGAPHIKGSSAYLMYPTIDSGNGLSGVDIEAARAGPSGKN